MEAEGRANLFLSELSTGAEHIKQLQLEIEQLNQVSNIIYYCYRPPMHVHDIYCYTIRSSEWYHRQCMYFPFLNLELKALCPCISYSTIHFTFTVHVQCMLLISYALTSSCTCNILLNPLSLVLKDTLFLFI